MKFGQMYASGAVEPNAIVELAVERKLIHVAKFDTIVGTGLSGSLVIPMLARRLRRKWAIVRKTDERRHSNEVIEGEIGKRWIFVDDCISSGATRDRVMEAVKQEFHKNAQEPPIFVGTWLYFDGKWRAPR